MLIGHVAYQRTAGEESDVLGGEGKQSMHHITLGCTNCEDASQ